MSPSRRRDSSWCARRATRAVPVTPGSVGTSECLELLLIRGTRSGCPSLGSRLSGHREQLAGVGQGGVGVRKAGQHPRELTLA
jgi:hypothetical protein